jgi:hypothetical protein
MKYLTDRAYGKAPQAMELSGPDGAAIEVVKRVVTDL